MKTNNAIIALGTMTAWSALSGVALAADTSRVYSSGILVLLFVGVCALVLTIQLIPAIMTLYGIMKEVFKSSAKEASAGNK